MKRSAKVTEASSCACNSTGWIELNNSWEKCPAHFKGQIHPETRNLLADEPIRLIEEERRSRLQFQINQYRIRLDKLQLQIKTNQEKLSKLEYELINRTPTVRAMPAIRLDELDEPEIQIVDIVELDEADELDLSWEELDE